MAATDLRVSGQIITTPDIGLPAERELRPGDSFRAMVREVQGEQVILQAGRSQISARTTLPLTAGQSLELQVMENKDGKITLKMIIPETGAGREVSAEVRALAGLELPDTTAGRQIVAAMLDQQLPLTRDAVQTLQQVINGLALPLEAIPALVFRNARGLPLTEDARQLLEEVLAGQWLPEAMREAVASGDAGQEGIALRTLLEQLTLRPEATGEDWSGKLATLSRAREELADWLGGWGKGDGLSSTLIGLQDRLETLHRLSLAASPRPEGNWLFVPALAQQGSGRQPLVLAVRGFRNGRKNEAESEYRLNLLVEMPHLGRVYTRLALRQGGLTCRLQVGTAADKVLVDAWGQVLEEGLRSCGLSARVLPSTVGGLDWLAEFWGIPGPATTWGAVDLQA